MKRTHLVAIVDTARIGATIDSCDSCPASLVPAGKVAYGQSQRPPCGYGLKLQSFPTETSAVRQGSIQCSSFSPALPGIIRRWVIACRPCAHVLGRLGMLCLKSRILTRSFIKLPYFGAVHKETEMDTKIRHSMFSFPLRLSADYDIAVRGDG